MPQIKLVIFDIAGTIIQDHGEVVRAFSNALRETGIPFSDDQLKEWKGASKREVIRHFVQASAFTSVEQKVEEAYLVFRSRLEQLYRTRIDPIPGAEATFTWCRDHDIDLATTTGFYREINDLILNKTGGATTLPLTFAVTT